MGLLEPATDPMTLHWNAPPTCPAEAQIVDRVEAMLARGGSGHREAIVLSLNVSSTDIGFELVADLQGADGSRGSRTLRAARCEDLATAAVLIASIAIDPDLTPTPEPEPTPKPQPTPKLTAPLPQPPGPPPAAPSDDVPTVPSTRAAATEPPARLLAVGLGAAFLRLASPTAQARLEGGLERDQWRATARLLVVGPSVGRAPRGPAGGVFGLVAAGGAGCFVTAPARWRGVGCLGSDLGMAFGRGRDTTTTAHRVRSVWWDVDARIGAELTLSPRWSATAHLEGGIVLAAPDFIIEGQGRVCCGRYVAGLGMGVVARWGN